MRLLSTAFIVGSLFLSGLVSAQPKPVASKDTLNFGPVVLRDSKVLFLSVRNTGSVSIAYGGFVGPFGADFRMTPVSYKPVLDPDSAIGFNVTFSPQTITANHIHRDSVEFQFSGLPNIVVQLVGEDHVPIMDTVAIDDTFLGFAGQIIRIPQRLVGSLAGALDSIYGFSELVTYDPQVLAFQRVFPGACLKGWQVAAYQTILGQVPIRGNSGGTGMIGPGEFITLQFQVISTAKTFQWTSIRQDSLVFGLGFEPLMSSDPGKATVIDSCTSVTGSAHAPGTMIMQNVPNPFFSETTFTFQVGSMPGETGSHVSIRLYDSRGQLVANPVDQDCPMGTHTATMPRGNLSAGVYTCVFEAGSYRTIRKVVVMP
ncbi:MAG: T9SS type A sorting domain-containing protein [Bacteroidota bacterium]|nr:T9SS type A sorting domain-containing protein [Bacteroidota bacterium]MDP4233665.1 T9SS type A sorting domain-containing protein [Bacteroidota bacterium]MDP4243075.1 T9SS type A sorting domain-containing protein [Bacteroidota bacterium]MDP4288479.1 T9SS type A sorting domain-containing protein [Bacteroidota bacterium]